jgi:hypothetical protein
MTKSEKRQLPDPKGRDGFIQIEGYPWLDIRFNQVEYKTPKHGKNHGLPVGNNGKTPKTEANAIALRDSLVDMQIEKILSGILMANIKEERNVVVIV